MQNNTHIKYLMRLLPEFDRSVFLSIVVFGERCELKEVDLLTNQHLVIKQHLVPRAVLATAKQQMLSNDDIEQVYQRLIPFTKVSEQVKSAHIKAIAR